MNARMKTQIVTVDQVSHGHYITSIEIAELVGKPHNDVLKAIRKMELPGFRNIREIFPRCKSERIFRTAATDADPATS